jgi:hypothetical protein
MSDPNRTIETRPTVSMDFSESTFEMPPREVVFFDDMAVRHTETMQTQLVTWPPERPPKPYDQPAFDVYKAIADILEGSRLGGTIDYDDQTWTEVVNHPDYAQKSEKMHGLNRSGPEADPQRMEVAVCGLAIYVERLKAFTESNVRDENVA